MASESPTKYSEIVAEDLNKLFDAGDEAEVDVVFVHGLRGHPKSTWEMLDPTDPTESIFWPKDLLPETIKASRIFSFGYPTDFATFYPIVTPESIAHTTIDNHSSSLILKLANERRDTNTSSRPIIFVAHSLGGLVVANALANHYGSDVQGEEVVEHTCGAIFLGTPFKGSDKAMWAKMAKKVLGMFGDSTDQTIRDLDKRSTKLQQISIDFHLLLQKRYASKDQKPIQVACFFEQKTTRKTWWKAKSDLGQIVTADSATLTGFNPIGISADHITMCKFPDVQTPGYKDVTGKIKLMISNLNKPTEELNKGGQTVITFGEFKAGDNNVNMGGYVMGHVVGTTKEAVNFTLANNWGGSSSSSSPLETAIAEQKKRNQESEGH
ncbi:alpha/beta-Hydrolase [Glarea lozoyensis ATCC 20868]|uniref:Alpha/beta-Hydrolase n=1 Tax=Glarea lozoyensis (strain ATCC 20868 / MF5171) TaxID=1116229 RepID=S3D9S3_GLAL2|nr:alpha/beta-Hydrolase [Glarea lozoyensis ATCC 20868]EPE35217.1 alpha/beta-Hydrolase [Glarea lozoyensis ATCC 20868]